MAGDITFDTEAQWQRFFRGYTEWIVNVAAATRDADGFVVGTELDLTLHRVEDWRRVIRAVREVTDAPLTYAANWTHYEEVTFWDDLDVIGIQAYFPLADSMGVTEEALTHRWTGWMERLRVFSEAQDRPIVFTELGYNRAHNTPVEPWAYHTDGEDAEIIQAQCMRAALRAIDREPSVIGAFLWKWFPNPHPIGRNFQLATPGMKAVITEVWGD